MVRVRKCVWRASPSLFFFRPIPAYSEWFMTQEFSFDFPEPGVAGPSGSRLRRESVVRIHGKTGQWCVYNPMVEKTEYRLRLGSRLEVCLLHRRQMRKLWSAPYSPTAERRSVACMSWDGVDAYGLGRMPTAQELPEDAWRESVAERQCIDRMTGEPLCPSAKWTDHPTEKRKDGSPKGVPPVCSPSQYVLVLYREPDNRSGAQRGWAFGFWEQGGRLAGRATQSGPEPATVEELWWATRARGDNRPVWEVGVTSTDDNRWQLDYQEIEVPEDDQRVLELLQEAWKEELTNSLAIRRREAFRIGHGEPPRPAEPQAPVHNQRYEVSDDDIIPF